MGARCRVHEIWRSMNRWLLLVFALPMVSPLKVKLDHTHREACIYTERSTRILTYVHTCVHVSKNTYINTHTQAHANTHTHTLGEKRDLPQPAAKTSMRVLNIAIKFACSWNME